MRVKLTPPQIIEGPVTPMAERVKQLMLNFLVLQALTLITFKTLPDITRSPISVLSISREAPNTTRDDFTVLRFARISAVVMVKVMIFWVLALFIPIQALYSLKWPAYIPNISFSFSKLTVDVYNATIYKIENYRKALLHLSLLC